MGFCSEDMTGQSGYRDLDRGSIHTQLSEEQALPALQD